MRKYYVLVDTVGMVYSGNNPFNAHNIFKEYCWRAEQPTGNSAGENVVMLVGGKVLRTHVGYNNSNE
jgi:hypothetical protein